MNSNHRPTSSSTQEEPCPSTLKKRHVRGRNGEPHKSKIFQCTFGDCRMVFTRSEHLARHERKHTGEKPFQCIIPNCSRIFSRFDNMMQHVQTHSSRTGKPPLSGLMTSLSSGSRRKSTSKPANVPITDLSKSTRLLESMGVNLLPSEPLLPPFQPTSDSFYHKLSPITELKSMDMFESVSARNSMLKRRFSQPTTVANHHDHPALKRRLSLDPNLLKSEQIIVQNTTSSIDITNLNTSTNRLTPRSQYILTSVSEEEPSITQALGNSSYDAEVSYKRGYSRQLSVMDMCNYS